MEYLSEVTKSLRKLHDSGLSERAIAEMVTKKGGIPITRRRINQLLNNGNTATRYEIGRAAILLARKII